MTDHHDTESATTLGEFVAAERQRVRDLERQRDLAVRNLERCEAERDNLKAELGEVLDRLVRAETELGPVRDAGTDVPHLLAEHLAAAAELKVASSEVRRLRNALHSIAGFATTALGARDLAPDDTLGRAIAERLGADVDGLDDDAPPVRRQSCSDTLDGVSGSTYRCNMPAGHDGPHSLGGGPMRIRWTGR